MKKQYRRRLLGFLMVVVCFVGVVGYSVWVFNRKSVAIGIETARQELRVEAMSNGQIIQSQYIDMTNSLSVLARAVTNAQIITEENAEQYIRFLAEENRFDFIGLSDAEGDALDSSGQQVYIGNRSYFSEAMEGKVVISDVLSSKIVEGQDVQVMAVPMVKDGVPTGVVYGILNVKNVNDSLENVTKNNIYTQIVDSKGTPVTRLKTDTWMLGSDTIWEYYRQCTFVDGSAETVRADMSENRSGYYTLKCEDETRITYYAPLETGGYYIFSNLEVSPLRELVGRINENASNMAVGITIGFLILGAGIYFFHRRISEELRESYAAKISSEEILRIAANHSNSFVFEYNAETHILKRKTERENSLFSEEIIHDLPDSVVRKGVLEPDSVRTFVDAFEQIGQQESVSVIIQTISGGQPEWYQILMKNIYDEKHHIINTVGAVTDVTEIKKQQERVREEARRKEEFRRKAERDRLTGLYNAEAAAEKIDAILAAGPNREGHYLFVFMDLDNFKQVNDTFGHHYGDRVLAEMAGILSEKFRDDAIAARLGGDEFILFFPNDTGFAAVEHIFAELVEQCDRTYEKDGVKVSVSASFGIAMAPEHGGTFEELCQNADTALYEVKRNHKKGYRLYGR